MILRKKTANAQPLRTWRSDSGGLDERISDTEAAKSQQQPQPVENDRRRALDPRHHRPTSASNTRTSNSTRLKSYEFFEFEVITGDAAMQASLLLYFAIGISETLDKLLDKIPLLFNY